jgi:hypothetical protein
MKDKPYCSRREKANFVWIATWRRLQSLSKFVGTHPVLDRKSIEYSPSHTIRHTSPPPSPINVAFSIQIAKRIKSDKKGTQHWISGGGESRFVEIIDFCGIRPKTFETDCLSPKWNDLIVYIKSTDNNINDLNSLLVVNSLTRTT